MPAVAEREQIIRAPERAAPRPVQFPLYVGCDCLWFPGGDVRRSDDARICKMVARENQEMITVLELRSCGGTTFVHQNVRHYRDPHFNRFPSHRIARSENLHGGVWDYSPGVYYPFLHPQREYGQIAYGETGPYYEELPRTICGFRMDIVYQVSDMAAAGKKPTEIAGALALPGLKSEVVAKILQHLNQPVAQTQA